MVGDFARKLGLLAHDRCALWAGGRKENHLNMAPYGCSGFVYLLRFLRLLLGRGLAEFRDTLEKHATGFYFLGDADAYRGDASPQVILL